MSDRPEESKTHYTQEELDQIVSERLLAYRLQSLEESVEAHHGLSSQIGERFDEAVLRLERLINRRHQDAETKRAELWQEIHAEFATRAELSVLESKVEGVVPRILTGMGAIVGLWSLFTTLLFMVVPP